MSGLPPGRWLVGPSGARVILVAGGRGKREIRGLPGLGVGLNLAFWGAGVIGFSYALAFLGVVRDGLKVWWGRTYACHVGSSSGSRSLRLFWVVSFVQVAHAGQVGSGGCRRSGRACCPRLGSKKICQDRGIKKAAELLELGGVLFRSPAKELLPQAVGRGPKEDHTLLVRDPLPQSVFTLPPCRGESRKERSGILSGGVPADVGTLTARVVPPGGGGALPAMPLGRRRGGLRICVIGDCLMLRV